ncbi:MAG: hypothetical protein GY862_08100 [Gammaproteobacteria bacterium]|nr:hypothetical protein [Gammaproteobacteria bacterium]
MSRTLKDDYAELLQFINNYSIKKAYDQESLHEIIKPIHKSYYAALILLAELKHQDVQPAVSCQGSQKEEQQKLFWLHLSESFSELGSSFFLIINGCYKASDQVMRSSIENFVKALGSLDETGLTRLKNVYEVFERTGSSRFFSSGIGKLAHQGLSELYGNLCSTVHTGTEQDMQNVSALGDFPAIDTKRGEKSKKIYLKIVKLYVSSLSLMFDQAFHNMHHTNRDIVQLSLMKSAIKELHR